MLPISTVPLTVTVACYSMTDPTLTPVLLMSGIGAPPSSALWVTESSHKGVSMWLPLRPPHLHFHTCLSASFPPWHHLLSPFMMISWPLQILGRPHHHQREHPF